MLISCTAHGSLTPALEWALLPKKAKVPRRPLQALLNPERPSDLNLVRLRPKPFLSKQTKNIFYKPDPNHKGGLRHIKDRFFHTIC